MVVFFFKLAMFFITEQSGRGAAQKAACTTSSYKAGNGNCSLIVIAGIPVTDVGEPNAYLGQWMFVIVYTNISFM